MANLLDQLSSMTVVVADTGDVKSIEKFKPRDATTNPSLLTAAAQMPEYADVVDAALRWADKQASNDEARVKLAIDRMSVEFGLRILQIVSGRVSTEVDARLSYDTKATIEKARWLIGQYEAASPKGNVRDRVLIKIASTWEGIEAARALEKEGIHCNLTLLFGMHQAVACAEAGVRLISPFVGRILDWHKKESGKSEYAPADDPGVQSVTRIYRYYKKFGHPTEVMGASFRNLGEITELAGCDLLTIAPNFLAELKAKEGTLPRKLDPAAAKSDDAQKIAMDEATFRKMHEQDRMAKEKLHEGIEGFTKAIVALEKLMTERFAAMHAGKQHASNAARDVFKVWDLDGDGFITREEWGGSTAVFDALDTNGDGRISPEEMAAGLGAAFRLQ